MSATTTTNGATTAKPTKFMGVCHWIDWKSAAVSALPDPTRVFSFLVMAIMLGRYAESHDWDASLLLTGFFLNPYVVVFLSIAVAVLRVSNSNSNAKLPPLPVYDRWAVEWYWWNAWFYHAVMDGASGSFQLVPVVVQQYQVLDKRFTTHHSVPWTVGAIELFIMQPLCLACVYCILQRHPYRFPLELITSTFQVMGMILFIVAEVFEGQLNVPALDPVGIPGNRWANVKLDLYHFTYYWFGFWFCNLIWGVVPYYRIVRAVQECAHALGAQKSK
jgi:hypothetical protein